MKKTSENIVEEIIKELNKMSKDEKVVVLMQARARNYLKKIKPVINSKTEKIKPPTMAQIDKWKHEARKQNAIG